MLEFSFDVVNVIMSSINFFILLFIIFITLNQRTAHVKPEVPELSNHSLDEVYDPTELSNYEIQRLEDDKAFDERIRKMKEEIDKHPTFERRGTVAEELHPGVHNLPHSVIPYTHDSYSDEEEVAK